jgi:CRP-like cAMP-binding protein
MTDCDVAVMRRILQDGAEIIKQGDSGDNFYIIITGG